MGVKMKYTSTRNSNVNIGAAAAIVKGLAPNGGLFVPQSFPKCTCEDVLGLNYAQTAQIILEKFLPEYDSDFLKDTLHSVYGENNFNGKAGFLQHVKANEYALELYHGPTCAFKDYALQLMPHLLVKAKQLTGDEGITKILVATSGDTGTAALAGFVDLKGIKIAVFYPSDGTSEIQRLQMVTQEGENVGVYAVQGNFDDAQTGVKNVFSNSQISEKLASENVNLSSANSINWGRLLPQIVYYYYSYANLVQSGKIKQGEKVNYCVPTGNFGDILAGYYAKQMGLPVGKLICASNKNNVLTDFFKTGTYNAKREFHKTTSPSMDILISSNLERLLHHVIKDSEKLNTLMQNLAQNGEFTIEKDILAVIQNDFTAGYASDEEAAQTIANYQNEANYIMDTHTAVAFSVLNGLKTADNAPVTVVLSTASAYKFADDVLLALNKKPKSDAFENLNMLNTITNAPIPNNLAKLKNSQVRFERTIKPNEIADIALEM